MIKTRWGLRPMGAVLLGASGHARLGLARVVFVRPEPVPAWVQRITLVDEALGRADLSRAIYEWREARGAALRSGRAEGLIAVGDRAIRLAELAGDSGYFKPAIVARFGSASARTEDDAILLVVRNASTLGRLKVGGLVHWVAEPFGVVWLAERAAGDPDLSA